jgi:dTDP-4-amino-4,6-dideoxyglucose
MNAKMSEFAAAVGLTSMEDMEQRRDQNRTLWETVSDRLEGREDEVLVWSWPEGFSGHVLALTICEEKRDKVLRALIEGGIHARPYYAPGLHRTKVKELTQMYSHSHWSVAEFPVTERRSATTLCLPTGPQVSPGDAVRMAMIIEEALQ